MTLPREVAQAWANSFLAGLPRPLAERLLEGTHPEHLPATATVLRGTDPHGSLFLVVAGVVRVFLHGRDGRQATARYAADGEVVGLPAFLAERMEVEAEALTDVTVLRIPSARFRALAEREAAVAWATARYLARQMLTANDILGADIFLPVRARVARHLLDLAQRDTRGLVVRASHQYLADAIGSVREVVSRELRRLAGEGLIERVDNGILLRESAALHRISAGGE